MGDANINATVTPMIPAGTASPLQIASTSSLRGPGGQSRLGSSLSQQLATDLDTISSNINTLNMKAQTPPKITQILLTNAAGQVIAAFGPVTFNGVMYTNYLSEIHAGNPLGTRDPTQALFNANTDGSVTIGQNGWLDVHDPFMGNAAWIGTRFDTWPVTNAVDNGAGLIRLTVTGHDFLTGNSAQVRNTQLYGVPNALGTWTLTVIDANTVDLQASVFAGLFAAPVPVPAGIDTYSPTIDRVLQVIGAISSGGLIEMQTNIAHTYETGDRVNVPGVPGVPAATGQWTIKVVDATHFTLDGSTFAGAWTANGICLRYYAGILAQTIAIGPSFEDYNLREFADGSLSIRNASITLTAGSSKIVIDPTVPSIDLSSPSGDINLNAATGEIVLTTAANLAKIVIDAFTPQIVLYDSTGTVSATIDSSGTITANTIGQTGAFSGTATVRNALGTGTSSFVFVDGICASYTP